MNLAGYIRVSTEGQVDAFGKDVQREAILRWASLNGHTVTHFYEEDGVSGKTDSGQRPALSSLLEQSEAKRFEGLVVLDPSRIARRLVVQETLLSLIREAGLAVFSTTSGEMSSDEDDPTRIMLRQILGVVAEFDHRSIVKRLSAAKAVKRECGEYAGGQVAFGTTVVGKGPDAQYVPDEAERAVIAKVRGFKRQGLSLHKIAGRLNEEGVPTKTGNGQWHAKQISRILEVTH